MAVFLALKKMRLAERLNAILSHGKRLHLTLGVNLFCLLFSTAAYTQQASCPEGWIEVARETSGDEITIFCGRPGDKSRLADLTDAIEGAAKTPGCIGAKECNYFVGRIGELANVPYFRDILSDKTNDGRTANIVYNFVTKAVSSKASGWRAVTAEDAQRLANRGRFVIGVARHRKPSPTNHGHIVIVSPSPMSHAGEVGTGPWVRDSQNPNLSVRASMRFGHSVISPIWAVWDSWKP